MERIAIGGSAANPPHNGHVLLISKLLECELFTKVIWVISGNRNDKQYDVAPDDRVAMTEMTVGQLRLQYNTELIIRYDDVYYENTPTYTCLQNLEKEFPDAEITWYTGSDSIILKYGDKCEIEAKWYKGEHLMRWANFLVFPRQGFGMPDHLQKNVKVFDCELPNISSSVIRDWIDSRHMFEHLVTHGVARYIKRHKLYGYKE